MFLSFEVRSLIVATFIGTGLTAGAETGPVARIVVDDGSPVYRVVRELERRYGWYMTYEDPPFQHASELRDVTHPEYRRTHPNEAPALLPRTRHFEFAYSTPEDGTAPNLRDTLDVLYRSYNTSGNPGVFADDHIGAFVHIHPLRVLRPDGTVSAHQSVMATPVSFPNQQRTAYDTLLILLSQVSEKSGQNISLGNISTNALMTASGEHGADNRPARDVLVDVFEDINRLSMEFFNHPRHIVWDLLYDPTFKCYFFSTHIVTVEKEGRLGGTVREER
jgi:hypothetical protein